MALTGMFDMLNQTIQANPIQQQGAEMQRMMFKGLGGLMQGASPDYIPGMDFRNDAEKQREWGVIAQQALASQDPAAMMAAAQQLQAQGAGELATQLMQKAQEISSAKAQMSAASGRPEDLAAGAEAALAAGDTTAAVDMAKRGGEEQEKRMQRSALGEAALAADMPELAELVARGVMPPAEAAKQIQSVKQAATADERARSLEALKQEHRLALEEAKALNDLQLEEAKNAPGGSASSTRKIGDMWYEKDADGTWKPLNINDPRAKSEFNLETPVDAIIGTSEVWNAYQNIVKADEGWTSGQQLRLSRLNPTGDANTMENNLNTLQATASFKSLGEMRAASKTGGALGNITERELDLLAAEEGGALNMNQEPETRKKNYTRFTTYSMLDELGKTYGPPVVDTIEEIDGVKWGIVRWSNGAEAAWPLDHSEVIKIRQGG